MGICQIRECIHLCPAGFRMFWWRNSRTFGSISNDCFQPSLIMEILLILVIRFYWYIFPESKRRKCIFRTSCSQHVYQTAKKEGFHEGLKALRFRFLNCRNGFHIFENPMDGRKSMILQNGQVLTEDEISERFIKRS